MHICSDNSPHNNKITDFTRDRQKIQPCSMSPGMFLAQPKLSDTNDSYLRTDICLLFNFCIYCYCLKLSVVSINCKYSTVDNSRKRFNSVLTQYFSNNFGMIR